MPALQSIFDVYNMLWLNKSMETIKNGGLLPYYIICINNDKEKHHQSTDTHLIHMFN